ncbi:YitT family protein [Ornithinibacillus halotolerans]|uniref:YitT family protein n=1 Tax=Ornithinibacillus halotolerans TaxID=1274357 RepID=A0A916RSW6_9BACI|nr:YitT family protein [Ornithinibacillus halotolerans]GGA65764.1 YitT family protein [Ornithinibacillus halotolerans]
MGKQHKKESIRSIITRYIMMLIGATLAAVALELFLIPNTIIDGGIIGVSLLTNNLTGINFGILIFIFNLPFLFAGYKYIGKGFVLASLFSIVALALIEPALHSLTPATDEPLLATVFGGLILGTGVGIVIRNGGALDGTEILGILLTKKLPFSVGEFVMFINIFIFGWAGFVLGWEQAMLSIITYFIAAKAIDFVGQGLTGDTKAALIVSDEWEDVGDAIQERLGRMITKLHGKGGYIDKEKEVIFVVLTRLEIAKLKAIVHDADPRAFITIVDAQEAHGGKFKKAIH